MTAVDFSDISLRAYAAPRLSARQIALKLAVCVAVAFLMGSGKARGNDGPPPPEVTVAHPKARSVPIWDEYTGRFEPLQQVEVGRVYRAQSIRSISWMVSSSRRAISFM